LIGVTIEEALDDIMIYQKIKYAILAASDYLGSYLRLTWVLVPSGLVILGAANLERLCLLLNLIRNKQYQCNFGSSTNSPELIAAAVSIVLLGIVVFFVGLKSNREHELKRLDIVKRNIALIETLKITREDRDTPSIDINVDLQTTFSLPKIAKQNLTDLSDLVSQLQDYARDTLLPELLEENVKLNDGSQQTIFSLGNTRFSTFIALVSNKGSILLLDRRGNENTSVNKRYDCFGSVGYENKSISTKLTQAPGYRKLRVIKYESLPGAAIEYVRFTKAGKFEIAIMLGHLAVIDHNDLEKLLDNPRFDKNHLCIKTKGYYPRSETMTSKAVLFKNYINNNEDVWRVDE